MVRSGNGQARLLLGYLEAPEDFLWTILVGNTLANLVAVGVTVVWLQECLPHASAQQTPDPGSGLAGASLQHGLGVHSPWFWPVFLVFVLFFYFWCELLPKMVFRLHANRLCLHLAEPFKIVRWVLTPVVWLTARLADWVLRDRGGAEYTGRLFGNREELRRIMQDSAQGISPEEKNMINRVLDLQSRHLKGVMVPLAQVVTVNADTPVSQVIATCRERGLTRLPVWKEQQEHRRIIGLVNLRTLLYRTDVDPQKPAGDYLGAAVFVSAEDHLDAALRCMQRNGQRLAIVMGKDRREIGVVSLQDILKAIFGEVKL